VAYLLKPRIVELQKQPLPENGSAHTPVARQWFNSDHMIAARKHACNNRREVGRGVFFAVHAEAV
jgi:hypothetical protein